MAFTEPSKHTAQKPTGMLHLATDHIATVTVKMLDCTLTAEVKMGTNHPGANKECRHISMDVTGHVILGHMTMIIILTRVAPVADDTGVSRVILSLIGAVMADDT